MFRLNPIGAAGDFSPRPLYLGQVRQRTVVSLGTHPTVAEALEAEERLLRSLTRRPDDSPGLARHVAQVERKIEVLREARRQGVE